MNKPLCFLVLASIFGGMACQKDEEDLLHALSTDKAIIIFQGSLNEVDSFNITASGKWVLTWDEGASWLQPDKLEGWRNARVRLPVINTQTTSPREGYITIRLIANNQTVRVKVILRPHVSKQFSALAGGNQEDGFYYGVPAHGGGYLMGGFTESNDGDFGGSGSKRDAILVKYTAAGAIEWQKRYSGSENEAIHHLLPTTDGGYLITGQSSSTGGDFGTNRGDLDYWVMKVDAQGNRTWSKNYGGSNIDQPSRAIGTPDGGYIISGVSFSNDGEAAGNHFPGRSDALVIKINGTGAVQWNTMLGGTEHDYLYDIASTADGNFMLAGHTHSNDGHVPQNKGKIDAWTVKLSPSGQLLQSKTYGDHLVNSFKSIVPTQDGGFIVGGDQEIYIGPLNSNMEGWLAKLDAAGNIQWNKLTNNKYATHLYSLTATPEGKYLATGLIHFLNQPTNAYLLSFDESGNINWDKQLGGGVIDFAHQVFYSPREKKYILAGMSHSGELDPRGNRGLTDAWIYCFE